LIVALAVAGLAVETYFLVPSVRLWILVQATRRGLPTLPLLLRTLDDPDAEVRQEARAQLKAMGPGAVPSLLRALHDSAPETRVGALRALDCIGTGAWSAQPDVEGALHDPDSGVRKAAADTLAAITQGTDAGVAALLALYESGDEEEVRAQAVEALGRVGPAAQAATPELVRALKDPQARVREEAAEALARLGVGNEEAMLALALALQDPNTQVQSEAGEALLRMQIQDVTPFLRQLKSKKPRSRVAAVLALRILRPQGDEVLIALRAAQKDEDEGVRAATTATLALLEETAGNEDGAKD
jgi:HEAT repeat protein